MSGAVWIWPQATQYAEAHECGDRIGLHGLASHFVKLGSMMNAVANRS